MNWHDRRWADIMAISQWDWHRHNWEILEQIYCEETILKPICSWCEEPMCSSRNKSADGNYIHIKCVNEFKRQFDKLTINIRKLKKIWMGK
jgi:formylmethanofuran dehydrogenase subunit E